MVTTQQAEICASFIADQHEDGEDLSYLPAALLDAAMAYRASLHGDDDGEFNTALSEVRAEVEHWMLTDPNACFAALGPGLGVDQ